MSDFKNKIIYYESSRGCPFSCSYCLSSVDKCLRFRDIELVKKELQFFIDQEVPQVKFVDRTFNCKHQHAMEIWTYLMEDDKGITNFHFEVAADLLNEEELQLIEKMRPGLIQLEIGVQSTNEKTIIEIRRTMMFSEVARIVKRINDSGNVHQHLDLIAGLPYEDLESFKGVASGSANGLVFNSVTLLLKSSTQIRFYFKLKAGVAVEDLTLTVDGVPVQAQKYGDTYYYIEILDITAKNLGYKYSINLDGYEIEYCALSYAYTLLKSGTADAVNEAVVKALYNYYVAAYEYFNS
jgi:hypothetical protein